MTKRTACGLCERKDPEWCMGSQGRCSWADPFNHTHTAGEPGTTVTFRVKPGSALVVEKLLRENGLLELR